MNFESIFAARDQLSLANAHAYLLQNSIDPFVFFVNNVKIKQDATYFNEQGQSCRLLEAISKAFVTFGIKLVSPLQTLAIRLLEANFGYLEIHTAFLRVCKALFTPADAIPIIQYPAMFKSLRKPAQIEFLLEATDISIMLQRYTSAYDFAVRAARIEAKEQKLAGVLKRLIILSIYTRRSIKQFEELISRTIAFLQQAVEIYKGPVPLGRKQSEWQMEGRRRGNQVITLNIVLSIQEWRKLSADQEKVLAYEGLLDVFNESQHASLKVYIQTEIKGLNWRIKASEIKGVPVGKLEVARSVNNPKEIYRYDSQEKTMYLNHKACDQQQLNQLITKAFLMQNEVNNCKIQRKDTEHRMGGLGGLGGMGFGSMFGGMMGGLSRKKRSGGWDFEQ